VPVSGSGATMPRQNAYWRYSFIRSEPTMSAVVTGATGPVIALCVAFDV